MYTFANRPDTRSKHAEKIGVMKKDAALFRFENQREPPSLSDRERLRSGTKSDILKCLGVPATACTAARDATVIVIDMPAVVHMVFWSEFAIHVTIYCIIFVNISNKCMVQSLQMLARLIYSRVKYQALLFGISLAQIYHNNDKLRSL